MQEGGPVRGLDRHMPAFGDALSPEDIALAVGHLRTFCTETAWPRGDLNLPRAFFTEKAFPENEAVWATTFTGSGARSVTNDLIYERRLGARSQIELVAPISLQQDAGGEWRRGLGDVALAFKRTVYANLRTGGIGAAGMEVILPTGKEELGLGNGVHRVRTVRDVGADASAQLVPPDARRRGASVRLRQGEPRSCTSGPRSGRRSRRTEASDGRGRRRSRCCGPARKAGRRSGMSCHRCRSRCRSSST